MPRTYSTLRRLFVTSPLAAGDEVALDKGQSSYLVAVLRMQIGAEIVVFNGVDGAWRAKLSQASKRGARIEVIDQIEAQTPASDLWYGFAPLKTERLDYMVQKATEMGAGIIQPVITRFTQLTRPRLDKIEANVIEAAEQCELLSIPQVRAAAELMTLIDRWPADHAERVLVLADEGEPSSSPRERLSRLGGRPIGLLIGPEGGFADEERDRLRTSSFVVPISLGPRILRADTAAVAALAVIQALIGDWR